MPTEACPVEVCGYNTNMQEFDAALRRPLNLATTRSKISVDAYRDMDGFDVNEELARLRRAIHEARSGSNQPAVLDFIVEAFGNIDENLRRLGPLPRAWAGSAQST